MLAPPALRFDHAQVGAHRLDDHGWRGGGEDVGAAALQQPLDGGGRAGHEGPGDARGFAKGGHVDEPLRAHPEMGRGAAPLRTQYTEAMGIVDQQQCVVALTQFQQLRHRRDVAVHAEHGIGEHELAPRGGCPQQPIEQGHIVVRIDMDGGAREPRTIDQAGVVQHIRKNCVAASHERWHNADVGQVTGAEVQRPRQADEISQFALKRLMRRTVPVHQRRRARAHAILRGSPLCRFDRRGMLGQPQVVVAAEGQQPLAVDLQPGAVHGLHHAPTAARAGLVQRRQAGLEIVLGHRGE